MFPLQHNARKVMNKRIISLHLWVINAQTDDLWIHSAKGHESVNPLHPGMTHFKDYTVNDLSGQMMPVAVSVPQ